MNLIKSILWLDPDAHVDLFRRAMPAAAALVATSGIVPRCETFSTAINQVIPKEERKKSEGAYKTLCRLDEAVSEELHVKLLGKVRSEFAEQAFIYSGPREDAAYALGVAVGLMFASRLKDAS